MNGLELLGGLIIFLVVYFVFPRTAFTISFAIVMVKVLDIPIFGQIADIGWEANVASGILIIAGIVGLFLDWIEHKEAW